MLTCAGKRGRKTTTSTSAIVDCIEYGVFCLALEGANDIARNSMTNYLQIIRGTFHKITLLYVAMNLAIPQIARAFGNDFDGDSKSDLAVFRPSNGTWYVWPSSGRCPSQMYSVSGGGCYRQWGLPGDVPISGDYDGDRKTDFVVFRPSNLLWYLRWSSFNGNMVIQFGLPGDILDELDFEGDSRSDLAVYRPSNSKWYIRESSTAVVKEFLHPRTPSGTYEHVPVSGRWDAYPLRAEQASLYQKFPSKGTIWARWLWNNGHYTGTYNEPVNDEDIPVVGNYVGTSYVDYTRWRPSTGQCFTLQNYGPLQPLALLDPIQWGLSGDIRLAGDYDGDGYQDRCVWRPSGAWSGTWFVLPSSGNCPSSMSPIANGCYRQWGLPGDIPID